MLSGKRCTCLLIWSAIQQRVWGLINSLRIQSCWRVNISVDVFPQLCRRRNHQKVIGGCEQLSFLLKSSEAIGEYSFMIHPLHAVARHNYSRVADCVTQWGLLVELLVELQFWFFYLQLQIFIWYNSFKKN